MSEELIEIKCCLFGWISFCWGWGGWGRVKEKDGGSWFSYQQKQLQNDVPAARVE